MPARRVLSRPILAALQAHGGSSWRDCAWRSRGARTWRRWRCCIRTGRAGRSRCSLEKADQKADTLRLEGGEHAGAHKQGPGAGAFRLHIRGYSAGRRAVRRTVARGKGRKHLEEFHRAGAARDDGAGPRLGAGHWGMREQRRTDCYVVGEKPSGYSETGTDAEIRDEGRGWRRVATGKGDVLRQSSKAELITHIGDSVLENTLQVRTNRDIVVLHHRRPEGRLVFLVAEHIRGRTHSRSFGTVSDGGGSVGLIQPEYGRGSPTCRVRHKDGQTVLRVDFAPRRSHLIFLAHGGGANTVSIGEPSGESNDCTLGERVRAGKKLDVTGPWETAQAEKGNYLPLGKVHASTQQPGQCKSAGDMGPERGIVSRRRSG